MYRKKSNNNNRLQTVENKTKFTGSTRIHKRKKRKNIDTQSNMDQNVRNKAETKNGRFQNVSNWKPNQKRSALDSKCTNCKTRGHLAKRHRFENRRQQKYREIKETKKITKND